MVFKCRLCNTVLSAVPDGKEHVCQCGAMGTSPGVYCVHVFGLPPVGVKLSHREREIIHLAQKRRLHHLYTSHDSRDSRDSHARGSRDSSSPEYMKLYDQSPE